ncbi:transposase family protein [Streptomyces sp. NPDC001933]|uniref:transposase family protein n=1 Tax=Streptomyces sp. NPDC001933 TaxID=3364626 RepID=UPI0036B2D5A2
MSVDDLFAVLFPHFALLHVELIRATGRTVRIQARGREPSAVCPGCGTVSERVHSGYVRKMSDTAISNQQTVLHQRVRRNPSGHIREQPLPTRSQVMSDPPHRAPNEVPRWSVRCGFCPHHCHP